METPKWSARQLNWSDSSDDCHNDEGEFADNATVSDDRPGESGVHIKMSTARFKAGTDRNVDES